IGHPGHEPREMDPAHVGHGTAPPDGGDSPLVPVAERKRLATGDEAPDVLRGVTALLHGGRSDARHWSAARLTGVRCSSLLHASRNSCVSATRSPAVSRCPLPARISSMRLGSKSPNWTCASAAA